MKRFMLIGRNISYSLSPKIHADIINRRNLDAEYGIVDIPNIEQLLPFLKDNEDIAGLNITVPYKEAVIPFLDVLSETAASIGSVNCIKVLRNPLKLVGYNTDMSSFESVLMSHKGSSHQGAVILGTGGAAKSVAYALQKKGIPYLFVSRFIGGSDKCLDSGVCESRNNKVEVQTISYEGLFTDYIKLSLRGFNIIINATPCGTLGFGEEVKFPYNALCPDSLMIDLVYNPPQTIFLREGAKRGCITVNGMEMLRLQAQKSWDVFI